MSEEILKALMQLFAIIARQDEGVEISEIEYVQKFLTQQLNKEAVEEYRALFMQHLGISSIDQIANKKDIEKKQAAIEEATNKKDSEKKLTPVIDSVKVLGICRKINKNLNQGQKVVTLVRLFELINADRKFSKQRLDIITTVAKVFKFSDEEFKSIETFVIQDKPEDLDNPNILIIDDVELACQNCKQIKSDELDGQIYILSVKSTDLHFLKYTGNQSVYLNGLAISNTRIYLFANGSSLKLPKGKPIYYSDVISHFLADSSQEKVSFNVNNISFRFPTGNLGLRNISISESQGKLVGIMGASGAGKTTLLNVLCGINSPTEGSVLINGIDLHRESDKLEGVIGLIPQDDLLIEELTVFQNLYFSAKQCFKDLTEDEIIEKVHKTLKNLGLYDRKDLKVGSPLNKMISGGQRKRLNIALELIREPSILFVDEPTSGLSSRDSENVMDLLSELTLKGKLIFVVIHQPSSDIYKMFDKMVILDTGGYLIYYGNPVEGVMFFKRMDQQINADEGECPHCGNITPESIFNIVEAQVVDEFGQYTDKRKVNPPRWEELYQENIPFEKIPDVNEEPPRNLKIPNWFSQFKIYMVRDVFSKIANTQYVILTLVESPLLAFILSFIIRYIADPHSDVYIFFDNENIPPFIFMSIVVSLFLGLTVSAEEIFRDRKILKREAFLNLSRSSYLMSKVLILFSISALQSILFVVIGNFILGIQGMWFEYWYILFAVSAFANMLGLNISASFNSAVTIYILIPLLMIPQMALGGAMFSFDKLNRTIGAVDRVPFIAEIMASRWAYEALVVNQFKNNEFEASFYEIDKKISNADFKTAHYFPNLNDRLDNVATLLRVKDMPEVDFDDEGEDLIILNDKISLDSLTKEQKESLMVDVKLLKRELGKEYNNFKKYGLSLYSNITFDSYNGEIGDELRTLFKIGREKLIKEEVEEEDITLPDALLGEGDDDVDSDSNIDDEQSGDDENKTDSATLEQADADDEGVVVVGGDDDLEDDDTIAVEMDVDEDEDTAPQLSADLPGLAPIKFTLPQTQLPFPEIEEKYSLEELESLAASVANTLIDRKSLDENAKNEIDSNIKVLQQAAQNSLALLNTLSEVFVRGADSIAGFDHVYYLAMKAYLAKLNSYYSKIFSMSKNKQQRIIQYINENQPGLYLAKRQAYHNEATQDYVKKVLEKNKILRYEDQLIQQIDPVFLDPVHYHFFDFRAHFYAPRKYFAGNYFETFWFNSIVIWLMTILLYVALYFDFLKKVLDYSDSLKLPKFVVAFFESRRKKKLIIKSKIVSVNSKPEPKSED